MNDYRNVQFGSGANDFISIFVYINEQVLIVNSKVAADSKLNLKWFTEKRRMLKKITPVDVILQTTDH